MLLWFVGQILRRLPNLVARSSEARKDAPTSVPLPFHLLAVLDDFVGHRIDGELVFPNTLTFFCNIAYE
jgi:hypothetical protein